MNYKSYSDLSKLIRDNISLLHSKDFDLIVGIPRSGIIPAYMIALYLNKSCCDIGSLINNVPLKNGYTRETSSSIQYPKDAKRILLVDDSIASGKSLKKELMSIPEDIKSRMTTLAIYSSQEVRNDVDLFLEYLPTPRVFEWNIFHHSIVERACFDIDGVLCMDPTEQQNDDGDKYIDFIHNATPLYIPTRKINFLVTSRLEKYREATETWLNKNGVKYGKLIMLDLPSKEERQKLNAHVQHKAEAFIKSGQDIFIESERHQAIKIHELTKRPVYCVETNEMFNKTEIISAIYGTSKMKKKIIVKILKRIPPVYSSVRFIYRLIKKV